MSDLWAWTWVRDGTGPWFPMRGGSPKTTGGYTAGSAILHPDEVDALRAEVERLQKALQEQRERCVAGLVWRRRRQAILAREAPDA